MVFFGGNEISSNNDFTNGYSGQKILCGIIITHCYDISNLISYLKIKIVVIYQEFCNFLRIKTREGSLL